MLTIKVCEKKKALGEGVALGNELGYLEKMIMAPTNIMVVVL